jgi:hypothetical protein
MRDGMTTRHLGAQCSDSSSALFIETEAVLSSSGAKIRRSVAAISIAAGLIVGAVGV